MTARETLYNKILKEELLNELYKNGFIGFKIIRDYEIFKKFEALKQSGLKTNDAIYTILAEIDVSFTTVKNAIRFFKKMGQK